MERFIYSNGFKRKILIVDDEEINRELLGNILSTEYDVSYAQNGEEAWHTLKDKKGRYSLILLDLLMPVMDGFQLLAKIQQDNILKSIPIIVMTSEKPAEVKSIKLGAADFITKPYDMPEVIQARCERIIKLYEDNTIIKAAEKDSLTNLFTKELFLEYIHQMEFYNLEEPLDAICLNMEHFHMINETHGRNVGDQVLQATAEHLLAMFPNGIGCRSNADNFYICTYHRNDYATIFASLQEELGKAYSQMNIRFRIGIYQNVDAKVPVEVWFDHAKLACNRIRGDYTKQICYFSKELNDTALYQERLINDIDGAMEQHDLVVYYQPKYGITGEEPVLKSAEALVRWIHPTLGMVSPGDFIPLFERNGLIQKVDHFVWEETAKNIREWKDRWGYAIPISVNISRIDIYDSEFEHRWEQLLEKYALCPQDFYLEITESAYSENADRLIEAVEHLREKGFRMEMDDFGSGYSSLGMITTIPIDVLKMDMSFIRNMNKNKSSLKLIEIIIGIGKFLDVPVVAEGVEEASQVETLKEMGCDIIQGYYFSKPLAKADFEKLLQKNIEE